jgi:hypothetical protein
VLCVVYKIFAQALGESKLFFYLNLKENTDPKTLLVVGSIIYSMSHNISLRHYIHKQSLEYSLLHMTKVSPDLSLKIAPG